jgi:hypothetical protein
VDGERSDARAGGELTLNLIDFVLPLHWALAWVLLPLAALVAASGALRDDLSRGWRRVLAVGAVLTVAALAMRVARHGLANWGIPFGVWMVAPVALAFMAVAARREIPLLALLLCAFTVALMGWFVTGLLAVGGWPAVVAGHDALFVVAVAVLIVGLIKHIYTPTAPAPQPPKIAAPDREAELQQRLSTDEAQEAADKYTRD